MIIAVLANQSSDIPATFSIVDAFLLLFHCQQRIQHNNHDGAITSLQSISPGVVGYWFLLWRQPSRGKWEVEISHDKEELECFRHFLRHFARLQEARIVDGSRPVREAWQEFRGSLGVDGEDKLQESHRAMITLLNVLGYFRVAKWIHFPRSLVEFVISKNDRLPTKSSHIRIASVTTLSSSQAAASIVPSFQAMSLDDLPISNGLTNRAHRSNGIDLTRTLAVLDNTMKIARDSHYGMEHDVD